MIVVDQLISTRRSETCKYSWSLSTVYYCTVGGGSNVITVYIIPSFIVVTWDSLLVILYMKWSSCPGAPIRLCSSWEDPTVPTKARHRRTSFSCPAWAGSGALHRRCRADWSPWVHSHRCKIQAKKRGSIYKNCAYVTGTCIQVVPLCIVFGAKHDVKYIWMASKAELNSWTTLQSILEAVRKVLHRLFTFHFKIYVFWAIPPRLSGYSFSLSNCLTVHYVFIRHVWKKILGHRFSRNQYFFLFLVWSFILMSMHGLFSTGVCMSTCWHSRLLGAPRPPPFTPSLVVAFLGE